MATYQYKCDDEESCGAQLEIKQSMKDDPITTCPECGKETLKRQITASNFILKGRGWFNSGR